MMNGIYFHQTFKQSCYNPPLEQSSCTLQSKLRQVLKQSCSTNHSNKFHQLFKHVLPSIQTILFHQPFKQSCSTKYSNNIVQTTEFHQPCSIIQTIEFHQPSNNGGLMVSGRSWVRAWSGQTKDYKIGICYFSDKHATLRRKSKDWLARNRYNVSQMGQHVYRLAQYWR